MKGTIVDKLKMHTPDMTQNNIARIRELFPNCVTEAKDRNGNIVLAVDFDTLRQELSESIVEGERERYRLDWPGKKEAMLAANAPIAKTLRPYREESVDFDTTQNLFIEGDNLDALKLLQESYLGKVKMIYIDPPYNTGKDFIYEDDFAENTDEYLERSNQKNEDGHLVANTESNGRFHSDWLSMMYPRLKLAKNLLADDGVIFISIDDNEIENLNKICNEIFGEDNFICNFIWKRRQNVDSRSKNGASTDHEYALVYSKMGNGKIRGGNKDMNKYSNPDNDPRGNWMSADMTGLATKDQRPNLHYDLIHPETGVNYGCPVTGWRYERKRMAELISNNEVIFPKNINGRPRRKKFQSDLESEFTGKSSILTAAFNTQATRELRDIFLGEDLFDFPKPVELIKDFVQQGTDRYSLILDFFAGSSTTAHAVMQLNAEDGGNRRFIMVQLPEVCDEKSEAAKAGYKNIAEISKERIRRAGKKIKEELTEKQNPSDNRQMSLLDAAKPAASSLDTGFRVLKVDSSNMNDVFYNPDAVTQKTLMEDVSSIKYDRSDEDLLFQVLLDWGVDLSLPIRREKRQGKTVFFVDENALVACFDKNITEELVQELARLHPLRVVFRDDGFVSDAVKINVDQIFLQLSPGTLVKSL